MADKKPNPTIATIASATAVALSNPRMTVTHPIDFAKAMRGAYKNISNPTVVPKTPYQPNTFIPPGMFNLEDWQNNVFAKEGRSVMPQYALGGDTIRDDLWQPFFEPRFLLLAYIMNWMLQAAINKVIDEVTKEGWEFKPKFAYHCDKCDMHYPDAPKGRPSVYGNEQAPLEGPFCDICGGVVRKPDKSQLKPINNLFEHPTYDALNHVKKSMKDILKESVMYNQVAEDIFWEVLVDSEGNPAEINPLPTEYMRIVVDGRERYFCPYCFVKYTRQEPKPYGQYMHQVQYAVMDATPVERAGTYGPYVPKNCPDCGNSMKVAKYVQINDGFNVVAAWSEDEIIHHNSRAWGPRRYSIPKSISVYTIARILYFQEHYQEAKYSQNKLPEKAIAFPDMPQKAIQETIESLAEWWIVNPHAPRTLFLAAQQPPVVVDFGLKFQDTQAKDMALYYREAIAMVYGVSLTMLGVQQPGKLGNETEQIEVSFDTIQEVQNIIEDLVNNRLIPRFTVTALEGVAKPAITDWVFKLKSPKKDDLQRRVQIQTANVGLFQQIVGIGGKAKLSEDMTSVTLEKPLSSDDMMEMMKQMQAQMGAGQEGGGGAPEQASSGQSSNDMMQAVNKLQPGESMEIGGGMKKEINPKYNPLKDVGEGPMYYLQGETAAEMNDLLEHMREIMHRKLKIPDIPQEENSVAIAEKVKNIKLLDKPYKAQAKESSVKKVADAPVKAEVKREPTVEVKLEAMVEEKLKKFNVTKEEKKEIMNKLKYSKFKSEAEMEAYLNELTNDIRHRLNIELGSSLKYGLFQSEAEAEAELQSLTQILRDRMRIKIQTE